MASAPHNRNSVQGVGINRTAPPPIKDAIDLDVYNEKRPEPFLNKHRSSLMSALLLTSKKDRENMVSTDRKATITGYALVLSLLVNFMQANMTPHQHLIASYSDSNGTELDLTTIPTPINTTPNIIKWTNNILSSVLTTDFVDYDEHMDDAKQYFSSAGYAGFVEAMDDNYKDTIANNHVDMQTIPDGPAVLTHMPTRMEPYWKIQIPIITTFSIGHRQSSDVISFHKLATVTVKPVKATENIAGHVIDSIDIDSGGSSM